MNRKLKRTLATVLSIVYVAYMIPQSAYGKESSWWDKAKDKTTSASTIIRDTTTIAGKEASKIGNEVDGYLSKTAEIAQNGIRNTYDYTAEYLERVVTQIDAEKFRDGWDIATKYASSTFAAQKSADYVKSVQNAINSTQTRIQNVTKGNGTVASKAGFVAEEWHTGTFNIDATAGKSKYKATRPASTQKASADVIISKGEEVVQEVGLKYYKNGTQSAKAQSKSIISNYYEYLSKENKKGNTCVLSFDEYLDKNVKLKDAYEIMKSEYASEYSGQTRVIPSDQIDDATKYLENKIKKESSSESLKRIELAKGYQETLDNLADKISASDGTSSAPLSDVEARALVELCENDNFNIEDFNGLKTSQIIKPKYVLKQSISAGSQSAAMEVALEIGPDLFNVIAAGIRNGEIDEKEIQNLGIEAAICGGSGFVEGSVSSAILTACQAGKFGPNMKNASPDVVGSLTVITIDSMKYGYKLSKGEMTVEQYGDVMAEEVFVALVSQTSGVALQSILPCVPFAYLVGSMVGGMIATKGYEVGKEVVLKVAGANGFEAIVPSYVNEAVNIGEEIMTSVDTNKIVNDVKNSTISITNTGIIKVKSLVKEFK
ncbi:MAG: hypothetical protein KBT19_06960 [Lachnospiraceae bacterium]|nr:hypothetical protein [Candidatus Colinaster equi]